MAYGGRTGETNQVSGIYRGDCGDKPERSIPKGHEFPPCQHCHRRVYWTLVRAADTNPGK